MEIVSKAQLQTCLLFPFEPSHFGHGQSGPLEFRELPPCPRSQLTARNATHASLVRIKAGQRVYSTPMVTSQNLVVLMLRLLWQGDCPLLAFIGSGVLHPVITKKDNKKTGCKKNPSKGSVAPGKGNQEDIPICPWSFWASEHPFCSGFYVWLPEGRPKSRLIRTPQFNFRNPEPVLPRFWTRLRKTTLSVMSFGIIEKWQLKTQFSITWCWIVAQFKRHPLRPRQAFRSASSKDQCKIAQVPNNVSCLFKTWLLQEWFGSLSVACLSPAYKFVQLQQLKPGLAKTKHTVESSKVCCQEAAKWKYMASQTVSTKGNYRRPEVLEWLLGVVSKGNQKTTHLGRHEHPWRNQKGNRKETFASSFLGEARTSLGHKHPWLLTGRNPIWRWLCSLDNWEIKNPSGNDVHQVPNRSHALFSCVHKKLGSIPR